MCILEFTRPVTLDIIHDVGDANREQIAYREDFDAGEQIDVDIYDTDGREACIQFPRGDIVIGIPVTWFRVVSPCHKCDDPQEPDLSREGPLGAIPRWSVERHWAEILILRMKNERARERMAGRGGNSSDQT